MPISSPPKPPPPSFVCPISMALMKDPVTAPDGYSYERKTLERWIDQQRAAQAPAARGNSGHCPITSPLTREVWQPAPPPHQSSLHYCGIQLLPNRALRDAIEDWKHHNQHNGDHTMRDDEADDDVPPLLESVKEFNAVDYKRQGGHPEDADVDPLKMLKVACGGGGTGCHQYVPQPPRKGNRSDGDGYELVPAGLLLANPGRARLVDDPEKIGRWCLNAGSKKTSAAAPHDSMQCGFLHWIFDPDLTTVVPYGRKTSGVDTAITARHLVPNRGMLEAVQAMMEAAQRTRGFGARTNTDHGGEALCSGELRGAFCRDDMDCADPGQCQHLHARKVVVGGLEVPAFNIVRNAAADRLLLAAGVALLQPPSAGKAASAPPKKTNDSTEESNAPPRWCTITHDHDVGACPHIHNHHPTVLVDGAPVPLYALRMSRGLSFAQFFPDRPVSACLLAHDGDNDPSHTQHHRTTRKPMKDCKYVHISSEYVPRTWQKCLTSAAKDAGTGSVSTAATTTGAAPMASALESHATVIVRNEPRPIDVRLLLPTLGLDQLVAGHAHAGIWCRNHHGGANNQKPTTCVEGAACPFLHARLVCVEGEMLAAYQLLDGLGRDALLDGHVPAGTWCPHFVARHHRGVGEASGHRDRDRDPCGGDTGRLRCEHIHHRTAVVPVDGIDVPLVHMRANRGLHFVLQRPNPAAGAVLSVGGGKECRVKTHNGEALSACAFLHRKPEGVIRQYDDVQHQAMLTNPTDQQPATAAEPPPRARGTQPQPPPQPQKHEKAAALCSAFLQGICPHSDETCHFTHDHNLRSLMLANNKQSTAPTSATTPIKVLAQVETGYPQSGKEEQSRQDDKKPTSINPPLEVSATAGDKAAQPSQLAGNVTDPRQPDLSLFVLDTDSMCKVAPMLVTEVGKYLQQHSGAVNIAFSSRSVEELESIPFKKGPNGPSVDGSKEVASFKKHFRPYVESDDQSRDGATPTVQYQPRTAPTRVPTAPEGTEHELAFLQFVVPAFLRRLRQKQTDRDQEDIAARLTGRPPNTPVTSLPMRPLKALNMVRVVMCSPDKGNRERYQQRFDARLLEKALAEKPAAGAPLDAQFKVAVHFEHPNEMFEALGMPQRLGGDY